MAIEDEKIGQSEAESKARLDLEAKILELQKEQAKSIRERMDLEDTIDSKKASAMQLEVEQLKGLALLSQELLSSEEEKAKLTEEQVKFHESRVASLNKEIAAQQKLLDLENKRLAASRDMQSYTDNLVERLTGVGEKPTSILGRMTSNPSQFFGKLKGSVSKTLIPINILTSSIDKVVEATMAMAYEQDAAVVQFNKATGASGEFGAQIRATNVNLRFSGVTAAEAGQAYQDLFTNVSDFTLMTEKEQMALSETTSILNELGISSKDTAANIQLATKGLGMSVTQTEYLVRDLKTFAQELGLATSQVAADFNRMAPMISELGTRGVQAFKNLQREAKATGIDMGRLYHITSNFDTYEGAAQSVGKLNAMLGGPFLNTMDMVMEEDPAERMRMLKESVDAAGLSFDTMSKFQRKALAEAMGLNDANELAFVLRGREVLLPGATKSAEYLIKMQEQTTQFNEVADEFKQIMMGFAISLGPLISNIKLVMDFLQPWVPTILAIGGAVFAITSPLGWFANTVAALVASLPLISTWWNEGFSPSGKDTFKAMKISTQEITVATKDMNEVQQNGIAGTTAATGMPAATAMMSANAAAVSNAGRQGPIILELNGRELARETGKATDKTVSTKLTRQYA